MIDARLEVRQCRQDGVALGGVQIAAAGIAAQGPAVALELLPGGQSEGQFEEDGDAPQVQRPGRHRQGCEQISVGSVQAVRRQGQLDAHGPLENAKWVRLGGPVEIAQRTSIAVQMVLGLLMIRQDDRDRVNRGAGFRGGAVAAPRHRVGCGRKGFGVRQWCILASDRKSRRVRRH